MGNIYENVVDDIVKNASIQDNDYIGENGLIYCGNCHTPKQTRVDLLGKERVVPIMCKCREAEHKEEEEKRKERDLKRKIARMRHDCFPSKKFENYTFEVDDKNNEAVSNAMRSYVDKWEEMKADNVGLLLYGDVGTGKSFYAACIANALIDKETPALMTSFSRIVNEMQGMFDGRQIYLDKIANYPLLILDDLGAERGSDYMLEQVYAIVDARYQAGKPLIVTTNIPIDEIKEPSDLKYKRIYDRVLELCFPVKLDGASRRREKLKDNFAKRKQMLGL